MTQWKPNLPPFKEYKKYVFLKTSKVSSFIFQAGDSSLLRQPSQSVNINKIKSPETKAKIKYLKKCLLKYRKITGQGRAITAVQVGISEQFSVVYTPEKIITIINPLITKKSTKLLKYPEICMSFNPVVVPTIRPAWIEFDFYDENGNLQFWNTKDDTDSGRMMNRIFQHEIDHMEGILCIDKIQNPSELILESNPQFYTLVKFLEV